MAAVFCAGSVTAQETKPKPPTLMNPMMSRAVKITNQGLLKWETDPESKVSIAVLSGNPKTGAYEAFMKFPAGIEIPLHWHTFSNTGVGVSGTLIIGEEGRPPIELGPGGWGFIPGRVKHTTTCKGGSDCVIYARQPGKDDIHFIGGPYAAPKPPMKK
jgi:quercetin dioxygenase-like cupin family protein